MTRLAFFALAALLIGSAAAQRQHLSLDEGWRFRRDPLPVSSISKGPFKWEWTVAKEANAQTRDLPDEIDHSDWRATEIGEDTFKGRQGFAWYRTGLGGGHVGQKLKLRFESVDDNATVFLNRRFVAHHTGWSDPFEVDISKEWNIQGPNELIVLVENGDGPGGIGGGVFLEEIKPDVSPPEISRQYNDRSWRVVNVPHDYVVEGTFDRRADTSHGSLPVTTAWYRRTFRVPGSALGKYVSLQFDGVYRNATFYLNGVKLGTHPSGYIGVRYDISRYARYNAPNYLAVRVDPRQGEGWWYEGGGIYRHVWLDIAPAVHFSDDGLAVTTKIDGTGGAIVSVRAEVVAGNTSTGYQIFDPQGKMVADSKGESLRVAHPHLWSIEQPNLYRLRAMLVQDGATVDRVDVPFGIRTIRFDPDKGFFLNGKPVKIKGTCNHQDHAGVGIAIPDALFDWRVKRLQSMGSNAYRCSHNPPAKELLDACDRLGMLVMDETRHLGDTSAPKAPSGTPYSDLGELKAMIRRDRNHPSIIMWSMFNEEGLEGNLQGRRIFQAMKEATLALDPTRPVTGAMNYGWGQEGVSPAMDLQGFNYGINQYERLHRMFPKIPLFGSETASTVSTRGIYANDPEKGYVSAYDVNHPGWGANAEPGWKPIGGKEWNAGAFVWTGFDYKGEPTPYGWPCINSHFGIMDICGFPKDNYYYYKAWWGSEPVVHILPHWNWPGHVGKVIQVWVHSNADEVDLSLNGKSLGREPMDRMGHLVWNIPYRPGRLVARGYRQGRQIAEDIVETTGAPVGIRLTCTRRGLHADGADVAVIEASVVDGQGRVVPTASNGFVFYAQGPGKIIGVGNGDPSSHEPDKATSRQAFNGRAMAIVQASRRMGELRITARSAGLRSESIRFECR